MKRKRKRGRKNLHKVCIEDIQRDPAVSKLTMSWRQSGPLTSEETVISKRVCGVVCGGMPLPTTTKARMLLLLNVTDKPDDSVIEHASLTINVR